MNRTISLDATPKRIISVVPSQTELLFDLGLEDEVIGITKFCIHPEKWFRSKTRIGGTKTLNLDLIQKLNPDLIIANKEENTQEEIEHLSELFPVWISDITSISDAVAMIENIGIITERVEESKKIASKINEDFSSLPNFDLKAVYLIWNNPIMCAGNDTFINEVLTKLGINNLINESRYPEITHSQLQELNPEWLMLSSEPYPFKDKHIEEFRKLLPDAKISLVDGEMFSWYGSRLLHAKSYFSELKNQ